MVFLIFGVLAFLVLRLSVRWRWRSVLLVSTIVGFVVDALFDGWVVRR
jgi:hypothetical protein